MYSTVLTLADIRRNHHHHRGTSSCIVWYSTLRIDRDTISHIESIGECGTSFIYDWSEMRLLVWA